MLSVLHQTCKKKKKKGASKVESHQIYKDTHVFFGQPLELIHWVACHYRRFCSQQKKKKTQHNHKVNHTDILSSHICSLSRCTVSHKVQEPLTQCGWKDGTGTSVPQNCPSTYTCELVKANIMLNASLLWLICAEIYVFCHTNLPFLPDVYLCNL